MIMRIAVGAMIFGVILSPVVKEPQATSQNAKAIEQGVVHLSPAQGASLPRRTPRNDNTPFVDAAGNHYICDMTGLYKLDKTGKQVWALRQTSATTACFVEADGSAYQADLDGALIAVSPNGDIRWYQRFSGSATFAKLIGDGKNGVWGMLQYRPGEPDALVWMNSADGQKDYGEYPEGSELYRAANGNLFVISPTINGDRTIWKVQP
jgi:hypothetical protein